MTISNFTDYLPKRELKKGEDYYKKNKVTQLEQQEDDEWTAIVEGRESYEVEIILDDEDIVEVSCECIAHTDNDYCKHVIAVLLAIQEKEGILKTATEDELETIIEAMPIDELRNAVIAYAKSDWPFKNFILGIKETKEKEDQNIHQYSALVNQLAEKGNPRDFITTCDQLQKKAAKAFTEKKIIVATEIALALIITIPAATGRMKLVDMLSVNEILSNCFETLLSIVDNADDINHDAEELIWKHAIIHVKDAAYPLAKYEVHWLDVMGWISLTDEEQQQQEQVQALIHEFIETATTKKDVERLNEMIEFFYEDDEEEDEEEDDEDIEEEDDELPEIEVPESTSDVKASIEAAIKSKKYKEAKQIAEKAMQEAKKKKDIKSYEAIKYVLMTALQRSADVLGLRELARRFYEENRDTRYYNMWKGTFITSEWEKVSTELIKDLERNIFAYAAGKGNPEELADVYIKEYGYDKQLMNLLKKAPRLSLLNECVDGFRTGFSEQLIQVYSEALQAYAADNKASSGTHLDFLLGIEKMQGLKGGKEAVKFLASLIKTKNPGLYKLLPATVK